MNIKSVVQSLVAKLPRRQKPLPAYTRVWYPYFMVQTMKKHYEMYTGEPMHCGRSGSITVTQFHLNQKETR